MPEKSNDAAARLAAISDAILLSLTLGDFENDAEAVAALADAVRQARRAINGAKSPTPIPTEDGYYFYRESDDDQQCWRLIRIADGKAYARWFSNPPWDASSLHPGYYRKAEDREEIARAAADGSGCLRSWKETVRARDAAAALDVYRVFVTEGEEL